MQMTARPTAKFHPGQIVATPAVLQVADVSVLMQGLIEHLQGQWGIVDPEDWASNDDALVHDGRLLSVYPIPGSQEHFYIITEADRSVTTFLLPSDY